MDIDDVHDTTASFSDINFDLEEESNKVESLRVVSCSGDLNGEVGNAGEVITRMELDLACFCEKIANLNILMMHVATWESEFEAFVTEEDNVDLDSAGKALEYNLLSGILDSEVTELDKFMAILHTEITSAGEIISSHNHLGETFMVMEEKLHDYEQLLKQSQDQVSEIRIQSAKFQRTLTHFIGEDNRNVKNNMILLEDDQSSNINAKINMQTTEQQRHILRMLEKSLAKEMDLEKKFNESRQIEEELKLRILSVEEELVRMEEEATDIWERLFEADNAHEVLMGISRDLLGRLQISHFNSNGLNLLEHELRTKLEISTEQLKSKEAALQKLEIKTAESNGFLLEQTNGLKSMLGDTENKLVIANSEAFSLKEKVSSLEKQLQEFELQLLNAKASLDGSQEQHHNVSCSGSEVGSLISELRERVYEAERKVDKVEAKCKLLTKCNLELNEELTFLKGGGGTSEKVDLLERQLRESDIQLQHALASAEASQEKQTMLYSTISDMDNVIRDLKSKVSKAETRAENVEEKCIILSESNADLTEELVFLRSKLEYLEGSLHQVEETKMASAKDIGIRTKTITDLVMRLAIERERLHKQISSLAKENKILVAKIQEANKDSFVVINDESRGSSAQETKEGVSEFSATGYKINTAQKNMSAYDNEVKPADSISNVGTVRRVDAGILNLKHLFMAMLVLLVSAAIYLLQQEKCPF
ncbi:WPP domain-interacting tail-anchored protein 1-like [Quillaja saponaria]|uniref:WPP domain-interacting tail-anchored protein 1-like n=1 Tax=Quillaja saponaria TaxID=32244 RepID=A0AAD7PXV5_QUISA|nr:WPP domain-interacting tail-anchored protein 1-like [Quillaja saponaria]KAJ7971144.1 WPP domain-interacting tail-anchored protein 1-like [Quillaja saponaria]